MLLITLGRMAQFFLMFAAIKLSTALLAPAEMAKVYLVTSIVSFYSMLLINPVGMFMNRRFHAWNDQGRINPYFGYFWLYLLVVCVAAVASLQVVVATGLVDLHVSGVWIAVLVGGSLLVASANQVVIPGLNLLNHRGWFVVLTLATVGSGLATALLLVLWVGPRAEMWISGLLTGQFIFAAVGWRVFAARLQQTQHTPKPGRPHVVALASFALPISLAVGLGWLQSQGYRFMMETQLGMHALGLFVAGYGISSGLISAFEMLLTTYLHPIFYRHISNESEIEQSRAWRDYAGTMFPSLLLMGCFIYATAPELTRVLLGSAYQSSFEFVAWGVIAELARVVSATYGMVAHARMRTRLLLVPGVVGAALSIALNWWLMPRYESHGVGTALALSALVVCTLTYAVTHKVFETSIPYRPLLISAVVGVGLIAMADGLRWSTGYDDAWTPTLARLGTVGLACVFLQYLLLRSLWRKPIA